MLHIVSMDDFSAEDIHKLLDLAEQIEKSKEPSQFNNKAVANLFFENSTRTKMSFEMAERRLGLTVLPFEAETSSIQKGESLYDTVRTLEAIGCDALVIRHPLTEYYNELLPGVGVSIINAGDGSGQHPSQCLLDLYTMKKEFGTLVGINVLIAGDLRHSRVAKSNAKALATLGASLYFSGPEEWFDEELLRYGLFCSVDDVIQKVDVAMMLRVQLERHSERKSLLDYHVQYGLTEARAQQMKKEAIIMHPAPVNRGVELADSLVESPQSRIFSQMKNGLFIRMALLQTVLRKN